MTSSPIRFQGLRLQQFYPQLEEGYPNPRRSYTVHAVLTDDDKVCVRHDQETVEIDPPHSMLQESKTLFAELKAIYSDTSVATKADKLIVAINKAITDSEMDATQKADIREGLANTLKNYKDGWQDAKRTAAIKAAKIPERLGLLIGKLSLNNKEVEQEIKDTVTQPDYCVEDNRGNVFNARGYQFSINKRVDITEPTADELEHLKFRRECAEARRGHRCF